MKKDPIGRYVKTTPTFPCDFGSAIYIIAGEHDNGGIDGFILTIQQEVDTHSSWENYIWLSRFGTFQLLKNKTLDNRGYYLKMLSNDEYLLEKIK